MKKTIFLLMLCLATTVSFASSNFSINTSTENSRKVVMEVTYTDHYSFETLQMYFDSVKDAENFYMEHIVNDEVSVACSISISSSYTNPTTGEVCTARRGGVPCRNIEAVVQELRALAFFMCTFGQNQ